MKLQDYSEICGEEITNSIKSSAERLSGKKMVFISSTYQGGGVAEMMNTMIPVLNQEGVSLGWRILHGTEAFFNVTKGMHNALQGEDIFFSDSDRKLYHETNRRFASFTHLNHDLVVVHDPQPLPMIDFYSRKQPWLFRCHIDLSRPSSEAWDLAKPLISKYNEMFVSDHTYKRPDLQIKQSIIRPAIDPLSEKNRMLSDQELEKRIETLGLATEKPIITQVSRFDKWKDPTGVIQVFNEVRRRIDCKLVMAGSFASDDPEGQMMYEETLKAAKKSIYSNDIIMLTNIDDASVNALQRASSVVIQKSIREGFGLTVTEALHKGTPVVASRVGGIPLQVMNEENGFLVEPMDTIGFSDSIIKLLRDEKLRQSMGENGKGHIRQNFLITRLMQDWLGVFERYV